MTESWLLLWDSESVCVTAVWLCLSCSRLFLSSRSQHGCDLSSHENKCIFTDKSEHKLLKSCCLKSKSNKVASFPSVKKSWSIVDAPYSFFKLKVCLLSFLFPVRIIGYLRAWSRPSQRSVWVLPLIETCSPLCLFFFPWWFLPALFIQDSDVSRCDQNANTSETNRNQPSSCQQKSGQDSHLQLFPDNQWEGMYWRLKDSTAG